MNMQSLKLQSKIIHILYCNESIDYTHTSGKSFSSLQFQGPLSFIMIFNHTKLLDTGKAKSQNALTLM